MFHDFHNEHMTTANNTLPPLVDSDSDSEADDAYSVAATGANAAEMVNVANIQKKLCCCDQKNFVAVTLGPPDPEAQTKKWSTQTPFYIYLQQDNKHYQKKKKSTTKKNEFLGKLSPTCP